MCKLQLILYNPKVLYITITITITISCNSFYLIVVIQKSRNLNQCCSPNFNSAHLDFLISIVSHLEDFQ
jgi:hypothetical protein